MAWLPLVLLLIVVSEAEKQKLIAEVAELLPEVAERINLCVLVLSSAYSAVSLFVGSISHPLAYPLSARD
jgi:hypothetical protein